MADDEDIAANDLASGAASRARGATGAELTPDGVRPVGLHRVTMLLVCLVWPLIWVGGLVTTYDAGWLCPIGRVRTVTTCSSTPGKLGCSDRSTC